MDWNSTKNIWAPNERVKVSMNSASWNVRDSVYTISQLQTYLGPNFFLLDIYVHAGLSTQPFIVWSSITRLDQPFLPRLMVNVRKRLFYSDTFSSIILHQSVPFEWQFTGSSDQHIAWRARVWLVRQAQMFVLSFGCRILLDLPSGLRLAPMCANRIRWKRCY